MGAGAETGVPPPARVELTDELEQTRGGCLQMRGQLGDLVAQSIHFCDGLRSGVGVVCADLHGCNPPSMVERLYTRVFDPPASLQGA